MLNVTSKEECCGCTACENICPKQAISMQEDTLGFLYPVINQSLCVDCGLCQNVCDFTHRCKNPLGKNDDALIYVCRHKNEEEVSTSQSGAATIAVSDWVLEHGGIVYGAGYGNHFRVQHKRATTREERDEFKGSKYVQSDMGTCFKDVKADLESGNYVLFTGTGCQVAGLLSYVKHIHIDTSKLITCDLICHGVPSPRLWQDYVNYVEKKLGKPVVKVDFRDKKHYGWHSHKESFYTTYTTYTTYTYIFYDHVAFRKSCYVCPYASTNRLSDFTVCDAWGYEKFAPDMGADDKGLSLMFVSTEKAVSIFDDIKDKIYHKRVKINDCLQSNMKSPSVMNVNREQFESDYVKYGFKYIVKKYGNISFVYRLKTFVKKIARVILGSKGTAAMKKLLGKG